jgi:hypothetical protein
MTKAVYKEYEAVLEWARLREDNRDMGPGDDSDVGKKLTNSQGQYTVDMIVTDDVRNQMIKDGVPEVSMEYQQFHFVEDGKWRYRAKRPHYKPSWDKGTEGHNGVLGAPVVIDYKASKEAERAILMEDNLGNGTKAVVKLSIYKKGNSSIVRIEKVGVTDLVEYEASERWF